MSRLPGISKSKKRQGKAKKAGKRFPVLGHMVDTDLHVHTYIPHLQPSDRPPELNPELPKAKPLREI